MSKYGMGQYDAFASTQIRSAAAIPLFAIFLIATGRSRETIAAIRNGTAMAFMTAGERVIPPSPAASAIAPW